MMIAQKDIGIERFETKDDLLQYLAESSVPHQIFGMDAENPCEFYCYHIYWSIFHRLNIGILSIGVGVNPCFMVKDNHVFIGYNDRLIVIWMEEKLEIRQINLCTWFAEFVDLPSAPYLLAIGEAAIIAVSTDGQEIWRRDTDLIKDFKWESPKLRFTFYDDPLMTLDMTDIEVSLSGDDHISFKI